MADKHNKPEEIVAKLRQVEVLVGQGMHRIDTIRDVRITEQTCCRWRKKYGGMGTDQLRELKRLQKENRPERRTRERKKQYRNRSEYGRRTRKPVR